MKSRRPVNSTVRRLNFLERVKEMKGNSTDRSANSIVLVTVLNILMCLSTLPASGQQTNPQSLTPDDYIQVRDALRRGGYREAAKVKGHYVGDFDPHWDFGLFDIESLTKNSVVVVVGVATTALPSRLTTDGQLIVTDYEISVQEIIKGSVTAGGKVKVSLPGGKMEFEDGTSAELRTPKFEHIKVRQTYALFLTEDQTEPGVFTLTGGPQGLVEVCSDGVPVKSYGRPTDPVFEQVKELDAESFLQEVRKQAKKWPQPRKCCT
jgi:hypothetical protein